MSLDLAAKYDYSKPILAIIGGGPAGLMAAEVSLNQGVSVNVYDSMG
ncbi:MAG TPA: NAD(P)/FAD-dependent oxidoreductase, partial [Arenimonas sp.]|nr:NAD(P)/FAD-dependent oxidoreductase [Arenimonas sp.]